MSDSVPTLGSVRLVQRRQGLQRPAAHDRRRAQEVAPRLQRASTGDVHPRRRPFPRDGTLHRRHTKKAPQSLSVFLLIRWLVPVSGSVT